MPEAPDSALVELLADGSDAYTWVAATVGVNNAAGLQLATEEPIMAIGGFNGTDPTPTLAQVQRYVEDGEIHYFVASGDGGGGPSGRSEIADWVAQAFTAQTAGDVTVYDLSPGIGNQA